MDRQTRFQSDPIAAALLAGDVLVRGAAAFDLHASLSLAAPAAAAGDLDLPETQGARAPPRNREISKPKIKSVKTEGSCRPKPNAQRPASNVQHPTPNIERRTSDTVPNNAPLRVGCWMFGVGC